MSEDVVPDSASSRVLRIGVVGLGRAFTLMLPTFLLDTRVRLVAGSDPRAPARERFALDFDAPAYEDFESLVRDPQVEVVYIASPHQLHAEQTCLSARHGKHVLVEKPMALSLEECDTMIAACEAAGVTLMVGHCHSFDAPYAKARELITGGTLGRVRMLQALDYTDFLYRPRRPEELQTEAGGGVVFSQAAHQLDIVRMLAGSPVKRVRAVTGAWDPARPTEGAYAALLWFGDGAFASVVYSGYGHFDSDEWCDWTGEMGALKSPAEHGAARRRLAAFGDPAHEAQLKAEATYGGPRYAPPSLQPEPAPRYQHFGPLLVSCEHGVVRPLPDAVCVYGDLVQQRHSLSAPLVPRHEVIDALYNAVVRGHPVLQDGTWARGTLAVCLALLRSATEGCDVAL